MQAIRGAVGAGAANATSDVALIQAILLKIQRAAAQGRPAGPYLGSYDGAAGQRTLDAIRAFQADHLGQNSTITSGQVRPGDATWAEMLRRVDANFANMRVLPTGRTVYLAATVADRDAKRAAATRLTFTEAFRVRVLATIDQMFAQYGIAVAVCPQGDRRNFQQQYVLVTSGRGVTNAGPGESNHNFGMAVDMGFQGLRWLRANGAVVTDENPWLARLDVVSNAESMRFWEVLRTVGTSPLVGAFRGPVTDRPHLQNWDDAGVSMTSRLPVHLERSGTMRWSKVRGTRPAQYSSDLGMGGTLFNVGTATQIWNRQATVTAAMITQARTEQAQRARTQAQRVGGARPPVQPAAVPGAPGRPAPVNQADVTAMRAELRRQFELADANWQNWTAR